MKTLKEYINESIYGPGYTTTTTVDNDILGLGVKTKNNSSTHRLNYGEIRAIADHFAKKVKETNKPGLGWIAVCDIDGNAVTDKNGELYKIVACEENFSTLLGFTQQETDQYIKAYGRDAFRFTTEKEGINELKKEGLTDILTYDEAIKNPAIRKIMNELDTEAEWDGK